VTSFGIDRAGRSVAPALSAEADGALLATPAADDDPMPDCKRPQEIGYRGKSRPHLHPSAEYARGIDRCEQSYLIISNRPRGRPIGRHGSGRSRLRQAS
jgi:hypothetical protein